MKYSKCKNEMRKARWEITNNFMTGSDFKEYEKDTHACVNDDVLVTAEIPVNTIDDK